MVRDEEIRLRRASGGERSVDNPNCHKKKVVEGYPSDHPSVEIDSRARTCADSGSDSKNGFINLKPEENTTPHARDDGKPQSNPPLDAPLPAGKPQSNPAEPVTHANGNGKVLSLVPQQNQPADLFQVFWGLFKAAGKALNVGDEMQCHTMWVLYGEAEQRKIIAFVVEQMKTRWRNEQYTPTPVNALRRQGWLAVASPRVIPDVAEVKQSYNGPEAIAKMLRQFRGQS